MVKYLLPGEGKFYKAAMHIHTDISDGASSPIEMRDEHIKKGYQIVAFTDHELFTTHNELTTEDFLAINAVEISINHPDMSSLGWTFAKTCHLNMYALSPKIDYLSVCTESGYSKKHPELMTDRMRANHFDKTYSVENINKLIAAASSDGFLVSLNHPLGSLHTQEELLAFEGLWGIECINSGSYDEGFLEDDKLLEYMLGNGKTVFPLAGDDAHTTRAVGGCFTMIKARDLSYESVSSALERGDFYSSSGPEIYELYFEDGILHVSCSPIVKLWVNTGFRTAIRSKSDEASSDLTKPLTTFVGMDIDLRRYNEEIKSRADARIYDNACFRLVLKDERGNFAYTRAFYFKELFSEREG